MPGLAGGDDRGGQILLGLLGLGRDARKGGKRSIPQPLVLARFHRLDPRRERGHLEPQAVALGVNAGPLHREFAGGGFGLLVTEPGGRERVSEIIAERHVLNIEHADLALHVGQGLLSLLERGGFGGGLPGHGLHGHVSAMRCAGLVTAWPSASCLPVRS